MSLPDLPALDPAAVADRMVALVDSPGFAPSALLVAFVAGAAHAVQPGHGKSLAAAYLVGSQGRPRDAAYLGGTVAVMHTLSSLAIALAWTFLSLSDRLSMASLTGGLDVLAGLLIVLLGLWMLRRWHRSSGHGHGHGHGHDHGHGHGHTGVDRPGLWLLGVSGGLVPSPAAFLLLVTGIFSGRSGLALLLVLTFGLGMAMVLFGVGMLALWGRTFLLRGVSSTRWLHRLSRLGPLVAAGAITVAGCLVTTAAVVNLAGA